MPSLDSAPTCPWKSSEPIPGVLQKAIQAVYDLHNRITGKSYSKKVIDFSHVNMALKNLENALLDCQSSLQCSYLPPVLTALESLCTLDTFLVDFSESITRLRCIANFLNSIFLDVYRNERLGELKSRIRKLVCTINIIVARFDIVRRLEQLPSDNPDSEMRNWVEKILRDHQAGERKTGKKVILN